MRKVVLLLSIIMLTLGCAGKGDRNPVLPESSNDLPGSSQISSQSDSNPGYLLGYWNIHVSEDRQSAELVPLRLPQMHLNALKLLQENPCSDCLSLSHVSSEPPDIVQFWLNLKHPYPDMPKFTGFDVRGIFITGSNYTFPESGRSIAWGDDLPTLINYDGYTSLFNPTEYPETLPVPPALKYIPGLWAPSGDLTATLNPYIAYRSKPRNMFEAGSSQTEYFRIRLPDGVSDFGYAISACWQLVEEDIIDPEEDFPPDANCLEAYRIFVTHTESELLPEAGSSSPIGVEVSDHQGIDTISTVTIECPGLFDGVRELTFESEVCVENMALYTGALTNEKGAGYGDYPLLVRVTDVEADQNLGQIDAWQVETIGIHQGWARSWGSCGVAGVHGLDVDSEGYIYVLGRLDWFTPDLDPGPSLNLAHPGLIYDGFYLSKFDSNGRLLWAEKWGESNTGSLWSGSVTVREDVYIAGIFSGNVDFDPGPGEDIHYSMFYSSYLLKLDKDSNYQWVRVWGGDYETRVQGHALDNLGHIYVLGSFGGTIDFDPGPGVDELTAGYIDVYLSKFNTDGDYQWVTSWEGPYYDRPGDLAADGSGNCYISGRLDYTYYAPEDKTFLARIDPDGNLNWARVWTGDDIYLWPRSLLVGPGNELYMTGTFDGTIDFDPGPGVDQFNGGHRTCFLSRFGLEGEYYWTRTWGSGISPYFCTGLELETEGTNSVLVCGTFTGSVDFDPGPGIYELRSETVEYLMWDGSIFLSRFDSEGNFNWARSWGNSIEQLGLGNDGFGNLYIGCSNGAHVDFDPGPGIDLHNVYDGAACLCKVRASDGLW